MYNIGGGGHSLKICEGPFCLRLICLFLEEKWVMGSRMGLKRSWWW